MKLKTLIIAAALALGSLLGAFGLSGKALAVDCPPGTIRGDKGGSANSLAECNIEEDESLMPTLTQIINVIVGVIGVVAVIVIVVGAILMAISQGDPGKVARARLTIMYAVIGLVIAILAYAIVNFALSSVFGGAKKAPQGEDGGEEQEVSLVITR